MKKWKIALIINFRSNNNSAVGKWKTIEEEVMAMLSPHSDEILLRSISDSELSISTLIKAGYNVLIAVGGDGTVNSILNELMEYQSSSVILGAIGIGSSNDFHKPLNHCIRNVPLKINPNNTLRQDVGKVDFTNESGVKITRYFIVNSSLGVTAEANWLFNQNDFFLRMTKTKFLNMAIIYSAVKTILTHKNISVEMNYKHGSFKGKIANVAVLNSPHVSGTFIYDQDITTTDGNLGLNYCEDISRYELIKVLWDLSQGKFSGRKGRGSEFIKELSIISDGVIPLETDGEIWMAKDISFSVLPSALHVIQF